LFVFDGIPALESSQLIVFSIICSRTYLFLQRLHILLLLFYFQ
jgi:hypothetical protein